MTVLLVEDDAMVRLTIAEFFGAAGLDFLEAGNAEEAFAILSNPSQPVDVLVTDLNLGPGENGLSLATRARHQRPQLQVVYETGSPEMLASRSLSAWERAFYKPFDLAALTFAVQVLDSLRRPGQRRQRPTYLKAVASSL